MENTHTTDSGLRLIAVGDVKIGDRIVDDETYWTVDESDNVEILRDRFGDTVYIFNLTFSHSEEGDEREGGGFGCGYKTTDAYTVAVINDTGLCPACDRPARASDFA